jgi:hypothetical protein
VSAGAIGFPEAAPRALAVHQPFVHAVTARLWLVGAVAGELLMLVAIVFCFPLVILAIGIPIAVFVQLLLWIGRLLL